MSAIDGALFLAVVELPASGRTAPFSASASSDRSQQPDMTPPLHNARRYARGGAAVFRRQGHRADLAARTLSPPRPTTQRAALCKLLILDAAETLGDLRVPPGNRLEKLSGDRAGQYSIRINQQWRLCFRWSAAGADDVEIVDYH